MMVGICYTRACFIPAIICLLWSGSVNSEDAKHRQVDKIDVRSASRSLIDWRHRVRRASLTSVWSSWSGWSACSRTCGGGAQFKTRHCMSRIPMRYMTGALTCPGDRRKYRTCNIKDCPHHHLDYRSAQCAVFNQRDIQGNIIREWLPVYNSQEECELVCHTSDGAYMYTFGRVLDGTRCRFEDRDMCINGKCNKVGCDGVLYSNLTKDSCGVCGGLNETCGYVRNVYTDEYPVKGYYRYSKIGSIPAGATNIRINDKSGLNYIAIKDESNNFILNGDWTISWPGSYEAAGTSIFYDRKNDGLENVIADGPLNSSLNLMIIFRERNPGVEYEYWLPPKTKDNEVHSINYNNEIQMLPFLPEVLKGTPEKKKFGTIESTNKKQLPEREESIPPASSPAGNEKRPALKSSDKKTKRKNKNNNTRKEKCSKCKRVKGRSVHFCKGSYAILFEVVGQATIDGETRYDVAIEESFKNQMQLNHREYLWVTNSCPCPKLRTGGRYIATGDRVTDLESGESRLTLERENLVVKYKAGLRESWNRLQRKEESICSKYL
ncbi:ADAMTS-like protein 5 [Lytechinus variegatus]|uniref:ADAMTS-like protein 5 n=1 Tax=Lytechinus variegatus TaxID=7654 RepID=UPI001BB1BE2A|nr:ADAMTS-like protein 5 [Lytechinus variegatus]XP_041465376.1 ADAMTS-like protein 5 [Lytechinus variegatus]XP_041465377.1 ADAMTS-like protein 5 [Lytechinus variegatus]